MNSPRKLADDIIEEDFWSRLRSWTDARIALGRSGTSLRTREVLGFQMDHAKARDAVHQVLDQQAVFGGLQYLSIESRAATRAVFLQRPDLGRLLSQKSEEALLSKTGKEYDLCFTVSAGLSSTAIAENFVPFWQTFTSLLEKLGLSVGPLCYVEQGRVAIGDHVAQTLGALLSVVIIGERPGLSSPDSMGIYLTYAPGVGTTDESRNCISNIRPAGLSYKDAAAILCALIEQALRRGLSGVDLKVDSALQGALEK